MIVKKSLTFFAGGTALVLAALALAGCGSSSTSASPANAATTGPAATVAVENTSLGNVLESSKGHTLYLFTKDTGTTSTCSGACAVNWPPLRASGKPTTGSGAQASLVSTTARSDGTRQITYNGHPLYLFKGDGNPGDTNGQGLNAFGGHWYAVSPAGDQVTAQPSSSGGSGGSGY